MLNSPVFFTVDDESDCKYIKYTLKGIIYIIKLNVLFPLLLICLFCQFNLQIPDPKYDRVEEKVLPPQHKQ